VSLLAPSAFLCASAFTGSQVFDTFENRLADMETHQDGLEVRRTSGEQEV
jgi:hypothetical protein